MYIPIPDNSTVEACIRAGAEAFIEHGLFFGHGTDNALDEAAVLVLHALQVPFEDMDRVLQKPLQASERATIESLLSRRIRERKPAAYLTGECYFAGLKFEVNEHVLVPRSPFAELILDRFQPWLDASRVKRILDLCTGSGCIAIACASVFEQAEVDAVDYSEPALEVARRNIANHGLQQRVRAIHSDLYQGLGGRQYELIVSNPPYVSHQEMAGLPDEYQAEPKVGFDGGEDGLRLVHRLLAQAPQYLAQHGVLYVEVGSSAETLQACYPKTPFLWQEFEYGGDGVFMLTRDQLLAHQADFEAHSGD